MDLIDLEEETIDAEILDSMAVSQDFSGKFVIIFLLLFVSADTKRK